MQGPKKHETDGNDHGWWLNFVVGLTSIQSRFPLAKFISVISFLLCAGSIQTDSDILYSDKTITSLRTTPTLPLQPKLVAVFFTLSALYCSLNRFCCLWNSICIYVSNKEVNSLSQCTTKGRQLDETFGIDWHDYLLHCGYSVPELRVVDQKGMGFVNV